MKDKGFIMTEALIVSAVVLTTLVLIYSQFAKINKSYGDAYYYNNVNDIYALNRIANFISEGDRTNLIDSLSSYLDITNCTIFNEKDYCDLLIKSANIRNIIFTYSDINYLLESLTIDNPYDLKFNNYIKTINIDSKYDYVLIAEFNDDTYASLPYSTVLNPHYFSFEDGTPIYFNVTTGNICTKNEATINQNKTTNMYTDVKEGCMKFYTFLDNKYNKSIKLILDHNTTSNVTWADTLNSKLGPTSLLAALKNDTDNWLGTLEYSNYSYKTNDINYSIKYKTDGYKARLITANEIRDIVSNNTWDSLIASDDKWFYLDSKNQTEHKSNVDKSSYAFIFDNLYQSSLYGSYNSDGTLYDGVHTNGYWTSDAVFVGNKAWAIYGLGSLNSEEVNKNFNGIRPVIEISKSKLVNYIVEEND